MAKRWAVAVVGACLAAASVSARADEKNGRLDLYFIDVEGGAATLFVTPEGESLLIDSGYPDYGGRDRDRIVKVAKDVAQRTQIDHALVSHWHLDHFGNHASLTEKIKIANFWDRGIPDMLKEDGKFPERIAAYRAASQNKSKMLKAGDSLPLKSSKTPLSMSVVTASRDVIPNTGEPNPYAKLNQPQAIDESDNAASISSVLKFGRFKFMTCGDLTWNIEAKLMTPNNPIGTVDVFMVTHHGLGVSNNPVLVRAIDPIVTVMCNGPTKGADPGTLATLKQVKSLKDSYQLHRNIKLKPEDQTNRDFIANDGQTEGCAGTHVKLSVAPDGESYTVQIGLDGKVREYQTRK